MVAAFEHFFEQTRPAFAQEPTFERARILALSSLVGLGRRTVSGMLCAGAQQFSEWSATYRLFERQRLDLDALFAPARRKMVERLSPDEPLVVMMDDTLIRKQGRKVHGTGWKRDPLGPAFCSNLVWGQRFLQISSAMQDLSATGQAREIPIDLTHAPSPVKPGKRASVEAWKEYRTLQQSMKVSSVGATRLRELKAQLDREDPDRNLVV